MDDLPNGFLSHSNKTPGFESAADAMRKRESEVASGKASANAAASQGKVATRGWQTLLREEGSHLERKKAERTLWGAANTYNPRDIMRYMQTPDVDAGEVEMTFDEDELGEIPETDRRWSWVEISLGAIQNNVMAIKAALRPGTQVMAVVKADGYGHGAVAVAKTALNSGASYLGVATVDEAIELRQAGISAPLLILSEPPVTTIPLLLAYHIMPSVTTAEFAVKYGEAADTLSMKAPYHLKVNTGMNRVGVRFDDVVAFLQTISFHRALDLKGTFTHFATADMPETIDFMLQKRRFEETIARIRAAGFDPGIIHAANSAATLRYPDVHYDMVRPGLAMYGCYPCPETYGAVSLMPAMAVKARITQVNQVPVGEGVSYGLHYRSGGFSKTCTIPIGYADGLKRILSGKISFIMGGRMYPQVGSICMDQCMFDVDQRTRAGRARVEPQVGDVVTLLGAEGDAYITADDMASAAGLIPYEVMLSFGLSRMPKVYV